MEPYILTIDMSGLPQAWVELQEAITYHAKGMVAWSLGEQVCSFRGGWRRDGTRSQIDTKSIIAIRGSSNGARLLGQSPDISLSLKMIKDIATLRIETDKAIQPLDAMATGKKSTMVESNKPLETLVPAEVVEPTK